MLDWFLDLFTLQALGHFMIGVGAASAWHLIKARMSGKIVVFRWKYVTIPFVFGLTMFMAVQNQQNADCVREFQQVLRDRSAVTTENDQLSIYQRRLLYDWIHSLVFPPPQIARLPGNDPERQQWAINLTVETDKKFRASLDQQRENDEFRAAHPLPPARCGL
jgi:hypothetical protein